jgi:tRNA pseudouridine38-40 synthase
VANERVKVVCAGRTDAGVHAFAQVAHFDTDAQRNNRSWTLGANVNLPEDVSVLWARRVEHDFHARFSATARRYRYLIDDRAVRPAIQRFRVCWHHRALDVERMREAAQQLLGEHDFSSFRALSCQAASPVRRIDALVVARCRGLVVLDVKANGFLHHMVRNIAGVLIAIAAGRRPVEWVAELLDACDRRQGSFTASPHGLYLVEVEYPARYRLPRIPVADC